MDTAEVLKIVEGLSKRELYYWEEIRLIRPEKIRRGKVEFREYSKKDLEKIQKIYHYVKQGFTPKVAYEKVLQAELEPETDQLVFRAEDLVWEKQESVLIARRSIYSENSEKKSADDQPTVHIAGIKKSPRNVRKISEFLFKILKDTDFELLSVCDEMSHLIAVGLSLYWQEFLDSNIELGLFTPETADYYKGKSLRTFVLFEGIWESGNESFEETNAMLNQLVVTSNIFKQSDIEIIKFISILPQSGFSSTLEQWYPVQYLTGWDDLSEIENSMNTE